jgi:hypothetical protein
LLIQNIDRTLLKSLISFLEPFVAATKQLEVFKSPTLHLVPNEYNKLVNQHLAANSEDPEFLKALKEVTRKVLQEKWTLNILHKISAFFDDRQKNNYTKLV